MNVDEMRKYIEQTPELKSALSQVQPKGMPLVDANGDTFWWAIEIAKDFAAFEARIRKETHAQDALPAPENHEECSYCGVSYPFPVGHHHTEGECACNLKAKAEREACAKLCEELGAGRSYDRADIFHEAAAAIRAGEKP